MASNTSGDKYRFLSEPDDAFKCLICLEVAEEPWQQENCGRLFCQECLDKYGRDKPCPNCRRKQPQYFRDNRSELYPNQNTSSTYLFLQVKEKSGLSKLNARTLKEVAHGKELLER